MTKCIICGEDSPGEIAYRMLRVKGYRETEREIKKDNQSEGTSVSRKVIEKEVLLEAPGEELKGSVCNSCIRKSRKNSYIGIISSGIILLVFLFLFLFSNGVSGIFLRIGIFLTLISMVIFVLPLFRKKDIEITDQFFLEARANKEEPVISVQDLSYYYGRKLAHWLMIRESHWDELDKAENSEDRILYFT